MSNKIVVFDLDETLGSFVELGIFWEALNNFYDKTLPENHFFFFFDMFSEFLRPNILSILEFILEKKRQNKCNSVMIYTNNQGPKSWTRMITNYFDTKLGEKTFDRIISAFKVRGKLVEMARTSHDKSLKDLIRCTKIENNTEICFLDDQYHPLMEQKNVFYINVKPYVYSIPFEEMANKYYDNSNLSETRDYFVGKIVKTMEQYDYIPKPPDNIEKKVDIIVSKKIMQHLEKFFNRDPMQQKDKTLTRRNKKYKRRTMKKRKTTQK